MDCKNFEGSEELRAIRQGDNSCDRNNIQQAANVALNGAIGSSGYRFSPVRKKRPPEEPPVQRVNGEENMMQAQFHEVCSLVMVLPTSPLSSVLSWFIMPHSGAIFAL